MKSAEESYRIKVISDPFVSGEFAYFTMNWIEEGKYRSSIYRYDGNEVVRVTFSGHEKMPRENNGNLYYISYSDEEEMLMLLEGMKEPRRIYSNKSIPKFIFHGETILALARNKSDELKPFVTERLKYRFDSKGFLRTRYGIVKISNEETEELISGGFDVVDISSNGKRVVFSATMEDDDRGLQDVYELDVADKTFRRITSGTGEASLVCISDGGRIAYVGHRDDIKPWAVNKLIFPEENMEVEVAKNAGNTVNSDLFVSGENSLTFERGKYYMIGQDGGKSHIYAYDGSKTEEVTSGDYSVRSYHVSGGNIAYVYSSPLKPSLLVFGNEYDPNPEVEGRSPERMEVNGMEVWLMLSSKDDPTVLSVHGGPQTAYGYAYSIEFNYLVDHGLNVLYGNPRGSDGYGEEFATGCVGDWGGKDFEDLLKFVNAALEKKGLVDSFAIMGGSYGGFMTNAAIVQTDRFKCAVSERCVSNLMSMCGTSDIGFWFNAIESSVDDPWTHEGMKRLLELSPITKVKNAKTPTLFIHGEDDYRCPIEQSEQMYSALRLNGIEAVLARYPGDSHEHARRGVPDNMVDRLERKLQWFKFHFEQ